MTIVLVERKQKKELEFKFKLFFNIIFLNTILLLADDHEFLQSLHQN